MDHDGPSPATLPQEQSRELLGGADESPATSDALQAVKVPPPPASKQDCSAHREFLWKVHGYTNEHIRFADTKAAFCAGFASALIGALFASKSQELFVSQLRTGDFGHLTPLADISLASFLLLSLSVMSSVMVIRPRLWTHSKKGFIFWEAIAKFGAPNEFSSQFGAQTEDELSDCLSHHLYSLAVICRRKYFWVNASVLAVFAGGGLAAVVLMFKYLPSIDV